MKNLLLLALIVLLVYVLYTNGTLSNLVPGLPDPNATPAIEVTIAAPIRIDATASARPDALDPAISPTDTLPAELPTSTPLPAQATVPPPTIIVLEPPPTLPIAPTPTPASVFPLTIETPRDGETLHASPWLVIGQTQSNALVSINDVVGFANAEGRFGLSVALQEGVNVLEVIASNTAGEQVFVILTVVYQP
jgi:hypothetical protein